MGAAYLAGLAVGYWKDKEDVVNNQKIDRIFTPEMEEEERKAKRKAGIRQSSMHTAGQKTSRRKKRNRRRARGRAYHINRINRMKQNRAEPQRGPRGFFSIEIPCFRCSCRYPGYC